MDATGNRLWLTLLFLVAMVTGAGMLYFVPPTYFPPCPLHALTGLNCPGCGATRAAHELLHGHLLAALRLNALFVLAMPVIILTRLWGRRTISSWSLQPTALFWLLSVVVAFGIGRNVPVVPFTWLAP